MKIFFVSLGYIIRKGVTLGYSSSGKLKSKCNDMSPEFYTGMVVDASRRVRVVKMGSMVFCKI